MTLISLSAYFLILCLGGASACPAQAELMTILRAAQRNDCKGDDFLILLAIRKAENGPKNLEFGIMNPKANNLDRQAGWCAASIVKTRARWVKAGKPGDFISFLGRRYCPPDAHRLNRHWVRNVKYWYQRYESVLRK